MARLHFRYLQLLLLSVVHLKATRFGLRPNSTSCRAQQVEDKSHCVFNTARLVSVYLDASGHTV